MRPESPPLESAPSRFVVRAVLCLALAAAATVALAVPASAHAILRATEPSDGATLDAPPGGVVIEFNEPVSAGPGAVRVFNDQGRRVDQGDAETSAERVAVDLGPDADDEGTYVVSWRAVSTDGHPVHGAFVYDVGEPSGNASDLAAQILGSESDQGLQIAAAVVRFLAYVGALVAIGGVLFLLWVHDGRVDERALLSRMAVRGAVVAAVATLAGIVLQVALVTGLGLTAFFDPDATGDVLSSTVGASAAVVVAGLAIVAVAVRRLGSTWGPAVATIGSALAVVGFVLTGHTASTEPRWLVVVSDVAHVLAAAAWFGGLVLLFVTMRRRRVEDDVEGAGSLVSRFSSMAVAAVLLVSVAGTALGWSEVRATRALFSTAYGWTLVVKVVLVAAVVAVGGYNQRRLVPALRSAGADAWAKLRSTVRLEIAGLLLVVAVTAVLVNLVPARDAAGITGPLTVREPIGEYTLDLTVEPNRAGLNEMHLYLFGADGRPADAESLTVGLSMPDKDIAPITREPSVAGPGHWTLSGAELPIPGRWIVTVTATPSRFEEVTTDIPLTVGG